MAQFEKYHLLSSSDESVQDFLSLSRPKRFHGYSFSAIGFGLLLILSITLNTYLGVEKLRGGYVGTKWGMYISLIDSNTLFANLDRLSKSEFEARCSHSDL